MSTATAASTDRIERSIHIKAPRSRVWRALSTAEEYGKWFGAKLADHRFTPGAHIVAEVTIPGYEHLKLDIIVERVDPEHTFSFRWHPMAVDPTIDYSKEERTLVHYTLKDADGGTLLTVVESGFDKVPASRRAHAFAGHQQGWDEQLQNLTRHAETAR